MCWVLNHHKIIYCKFNWTILALIFISRSHILRMYHLFLQPEPEFRPPMSEVVQQLVRLMQRASIVRRQSGEELGFSYRAPEREGDLRDISFWVRSKSFHDTSANQLRGSICLGKIWNVHMNWRSWADDENSEPDEFEKIILILIDQLCSFFYVPSILQLVSVLLLDLNWGSNRWRCIAGYWYRQRKRNVNWFLLGSFEF